MRVIYVMEQNSLCGGHKDVFEQANRLFDRGHQVEIWNIAEDHSHWFPLRVPVVVMGNYPQATAMLKETDAVKIATWWKTAHPVAAAGGSHYFVQDIESSYGQSDQERSEALSTYDLGLRLFTESRWVGRELVSMGHAADWVGIGVDRSIFFPGGPSEHSGVIFHERDHFLKGPEMRAQVLQMCARSGIRTVGYSPWRGNPHASEHMHSPSDAQLAARMRRSLCLLVTSLHEGFCMPALEAMACGLPVVCTDADGNDFCIDGFNCLKADTAAGLVEQIHRLKDESLWGYLSANALHTAAEHDWDSVIDRLEHTLWN